MTQSGPDQTTHDQVTDSQTTDGNLAEELVEEISIDGMCGVY